MLKSNDNLKMKHYQYIEPKSIIILVHTHNHIVDIRDGNLRLNHSTRPRLGRPLTRPIV